MTIDLAAMLRRWVSASPPPPTPSPRPTPPMRLAFRPLDPGEASCSVVLMRPRGSGARLCIRKPQYQVWDGTEWRAMCALHRTVQERIDEAGLTGTQLKRGPRDDGE